MNTRRRLLPAAVSVRGFGGLYSNKLLMLEDVDRIEVIRGPGGAVWGANAVNAVINILTRPADDTVGLLVRAGGGTFDQGNLAVRYGARAYRVYAQLSDHGNSLLSPRVAANDHWRSLPAGFRSDWSAGPDAFLVQRGLTTGLERPLWISLDPAVAGQSDTRGTATTPVGNVLGRWTRTGNDDGRLQVQSFVDVAHRRGSIDEYGRHTFDVDAASHTTIGRRHDIIAGGGYRYISETMEGGLGYAFTPDNQHATLVNAFAQDEIAVVPRRLTPTLGGKIEQRESPSDMAILT